MAYTPTNWVTGDTVTATKLNKMEQGIANAGGVTPYIVNVTGNSASITADKTYNEVKTAFLTGAPVFFDFSNASGWSGVYIICGCADDGETFDVFMLMVSGSLTMSANSANGYPTWVD